MKTVHLSERLIEVQEGVFLLPPNSAEYVSVDMDGWVVFHDERPEEAGYAWTSACANLALQHTEAEYSLHRIVRHDSGRLNKLEKIDLGTRMP